jgi:DNA-binding protein YbaB
MMRLEEAWAPVTDDHDEAAARTVVEWSGDGALMIEVDWSGEAVRVQLEPQATRSLTADVLADRIVRLHRLALMRARAEQRQRLNDCGVAIGPTAGFPSHADVEEYRRTIDF